MRLHQLEVTAFGPFADTIRVDFDALSDAGLFLLSGPTGAGKSSVLDAVCFALYGDVPGDRSTAKRLRCDQADEGVAPRVVLELTLSGRRFRLDRSPSWQRPKKRGTGTTTEQARITLSERVPCAGGAQWRPLSTRLDEAGHLVTRLVGMNLPQFCQVALLPQGRFQAFLRAGSDERHALLQQVFRTGRFDQVEAWLRHRRIELRRQSEAHQGRIADHVSRISEVTSCPAPDDWAAHPDELFSWVEELDASTSQQLRDAVEGLQLALEAEATARSEEEKAAKLAEALERLQETQVRAEALEAQADQRADAAARLESARRAMVVQPLHQAALAMQAQVDATDLDLARALHQLADAAGEQVDDPACVEMIRDRTIAQLAEVERLRPVAARAREVARERAVLLSDLDALRHRSTQVDELALGLPGRVEALREQVQTVATSAARAEVLRERVASLQERQAAARLVVELEGQTAVGESDKASAVAELQAAKEDWLSVRERRLDGMAAEMASSLVVGGCCPVCGSAEHPSPAVAAQGAPDVEAERSARRVVDDLEVVVEARSQHLRDLESRLATARGAAGHDLDALPSTIEQSKHALREAQDHREQLPVLAEELTRTEERLAHLHQEREQVARDIAATQAKADRLGHELESSEAQVDSVLTGTSSVDLADLADRLRSAQQAATRAEIARARHEAACTRRDQTRDHVSRAANDAGFASPEEAVAAWMSPEQMADLETWVAEHDRARDRVQQVLADPALQGAADASSPDLAVLQSTHATARQHTASIRRTHDILARRASRLEGLAADIEQALASWEPVRHDLDTVAALSSFVEGKSPDNRLQMRLSAYVLAHRLSQVVDAANLRLLTMSDQRFSLIHTGQRGVGERRGGLSLVVRDDWSGESRDPATLSGGETFVVSLALALGLADVITAEAGGADLDTLFVDEGFGSLDAETLDDVMDTLDSLREGGRVVGVVSHVAEMQVRIPTQLRVDKARHGSRVTQ